MPGLIEGGGTLNTAFHDLAKECFPFVIDFIDASNHVVHTITVAEPGVIKVPGLAKDHGPCSVRVSYATGEVVTIPAPE
jgi:hypothetical protein